MTVQSQAVKPETGNPFVAEVADMLFATKSLDKISEGKGSWGDLATVGITAASFFIAPAKIMLLGSKALNAVIKASSKVVASDTASVAAKRAAAKTLDDALTVKRQGYVPTGDEPIQFTGRAGMPESTPSPIVPDRFTPTPKHLDDLFGTPESGQEVIPYAMKGKPKATRTSGSRDLRADDVYDGTLDVKDLTIRRQPRKTQAPSGRLVTAYAADSPSKLTTYILDEIDGLYASSAKMSDREFNSQRASILLQLFPESNLLPDIPDVTRTSRELFTSSAAITNTKKKAIIRDLRDSQDPNKIRLADELEDLDIKTLKQESIDMGQGKTKLKETPYETTGARSAIQPELDDVLYQKELAEGMLKTTDDSDAIFKIEQKIKSLNKRATDLQKYIDEPYSSGAIDQTKKIIPNRRPGRETVEYKSPKSYTARESVKKSGKAPDSPKRSTLSELKSDEETILKQLKTAEPSQRKALQTDLKRTREEIMNVQVGRLRQSLDDQVKNIPAAAKSVENLTLRELESEIIRLRKGYKELSKFTGEEAEEAIEQVASRGKAIRELLNEARTRSGKPASDMANISGTLEAKATGLVVRWNKLTTAEKASAVYIGRGAGTKGKFGNPFPVGGGVTVKESVNKYRTYLFEKIKSDSEYAKDLYALKGKKLACPGSEPNDACHGAVILRAIKYLEENPELMKGN